MRIGVDGRALSAARERRGVAVYVERLLAELARLAPEDEYRVLVDGDPRDGAVPDAPNVTTVRVSGGSVTRASAALVGRPRLDRQLGGPDLVWIPAPAPVAVSPDVPYVLTIHDLSFTHRPEDFSAYERAWHRATRPRRLAERARRVLTDTAHVRQQLMAEWDLPAEQVRAVLLGPGSASPVRGSPEPTEPLYVLAVGALEPRKQPLQLAWAHALARERGLRAGLVFAGDGPLRPELEATGATLLGTATDDELGAAYANALCLACVSREEGFGFTPLEALAAGVPPVVSDLPVFTETLGEAALRVPADDADALSDALLRLEGEPDLREQLVKAGRARIADMTWERAALDTRAVFGEALA
jgi:glycosyltransferase involved in cell wall biosynthesis